VPAQVQRTACAVAAGAGGLYPIFYRISLLCDLYQLRSREDENTNLKGHLLVLSAELQKRDGVSLSLARSPSYPPNARTPSVENTVSPSTCHPSLAQQNSHGSSRGTPVSMSRSTPDHSADFSPSELLARVASMQQQLVEAQVSSLRDR
jgi:hypothetical protein